VLGAVLMATGKAKTAEEAVVLMRYAVDVRGLAR
jgi:hypothetical protein